MLIVIAILLSAVAIFVVAYPIVLQPRSARPAASSAQETLAELLAQREAAFQALRELNFDHRVGKITDEDFVAFEAHLKQVAADALRALDSWEAEADDTLDHAIARAVLDQRRAASRSGDRACPTCGLPATSEDRFCAGCGTALPDRTAAEIDRACSGCGLPYQKGDRFCASCGQPLPAAAPAVQSAN